MYKYLLRPGFVSNKLLIQIFSGVEKENFFSDFLNTIAELKPKIVDIHDLWMNDEILFEIDSEKGIFTFSKDICDLAFIMAENNQECILQINSILESSEIFKKINPDFDKY